MMGEILFLAHRIPFPPDRGDKIRSHHILRRLARIAPVHVATLADDDVDLDHEEELAALAESHCLVSRTRPLGIAGLEALATRVPVSLAAFRHRALQAYVEEVLRTRPISAIYVFSGQMGQYVPSGFAGRVVVDFVDVDSAKFEAYAAAGRGLRGWIDAREARMLRLEEIRLARRADVSLLISQDEADLFEARLTPEVRGTVAVGTLANGIDSDLFDPAQVEVEPRIGGCPSPRLIFTGQMDYAPNIAAARRAIDRILPIVREQAPDASLHIVGRNPPAALLEHHGREGCFVWGRVPDMRTWLKGADVALVPLDIGRGVQNKVLEAMAMRLPVVLTPEAATGIGAYAGRDLAVAQGDAELAVAVCELLADPDRARGMGEAARAFIVDEMNWEAALSRLPEIMGLPDRSCRDAA